MATIPLQIQTPQQQSPLQNLGQLMGVRDLASQIALRNQQTQAAAANTQDVQAQAQQRQQQIRDSQTIMQSMQDPDVSARIHVGDYSDLEGRVSPVALQALEQQRSTLKSNQLAQTKEQNQIQVDAKQQLVDALIGNLHTHTDADGNVDLAAINAGWPTTTSALADAYKNSGIQTPMPQSWSSPDQIKSAIASLGGGIALQKDTLATQQAQATTRETVAKASGAELENQLKQAKLNLFQRLSANPAGIDQQVDALGLSPAVAASTKVMAHAAKDYDGIQEALNKGLTDERDRQKAVAVETAEAPTKIAIAGANAQASAQAQARERAIDKVSASEAGYYDVEAKGDMLKTLAANSVAGDSTAAQTFKSSLPLFLNALQGSHRLAGAQLDQTPGSVFDRAAALLSGYTKGQPIPTRELQEAPGVIDAAVQSAAQAHNGLADVYSRNYGISAPHVAPRKIFPAARVHDYAVAHGMDDAAAQKAITTAGYKIQ